MTGSSPAAKLQIPTQSMLHLVQDPGSDSLQETSALGISGQSYQET